MAFQTVFGAENSVIAIIISILMGITAGKDVSAAPVKNYLTQLAVFGGMCVAACFSVALGPWLAIPINLTVILAVAYAYTYEYSAHLYFPYILSYLFLLYISPVTPDRLPMRLLSVAAGCLVTVLYAFILSRRNIHKPARYYFTEIVDDIASVVKAREEGMLIPEIKEKVRKAVVKLCRNADNRRQGLFNIPDRVIAYLDAARGAETLAVFLSDLTESCGIPWKKAAETLSKFRDFIGGKAADIADIDAADYDADENARYVYCRLRFIRRNLLASAQKGKKNSVSFSVKSAVKRLLIKLKSGYSRVRLIYALRVAVLITAFIIPIQYFALPHGKWLLFTLASVSLPYADDVPSKGIDRMLATVIGGAIAFVGFSLIRGAVGRTVLLYLSGYLSFYFKKYIGNYAMATIGALGGAVMAGAYGWAQVGTVFGIRLGYIAVGIAIAFAANLLVFPFRRKSASEDLYRKYELTSKYLTELDPSTLDRGLYYRIVLENNMLEDKLLENAQKSGSSLLAPVVESRRREIRKAHHERFGNSSDAS